MGLLTIVLVFLFIAVWKAPAWVREIGHIALILGFLSTLLGFAQAGDAISKAGDVSMDLIASGIKIALIPTIYGGLIYLVSLIMRIILKPRI
jgi:biopolymer transport protein ExbB/TolQ